MRQPVQHDGHATLVQPRGDFLTQTGYPMRQLVAAAWSLAQPERNARRHAVRVFHAQPVALHAQDAIAGVAELEHIASEAFHGEVFVDRTDDGGLRLKHHQIVRGVGDGAA